ncbi:hypothetical protein MMC07_009890, partial [Pseudocyphellaria aurata]|nr:hypothetical protein [Pseudocyphellaria aurata]
YWDWAKYADDQASSPLFDGSAYSLSGNGKSIPHEDFTYTIPQTAYEATIPASNGGGCVQGGPFANMTVNLGPVNSSGSLPGYIGDGRGFDYNPRCLRRDLNSYWSSTYLDYQHVSSAIGNSSTFSEFNETLGYPGLHTLGHFVIGGMNDDLFISAADPAFYFHHAQLDRVWTIWQQQDVAKRQYQLTGTTTWFNIPPSPNITLAEPMDMGFLGASQSTGDVMSTLDGPLCYVY